jgi:pimeloyl-ACP methyl ester carboxylesterase
MVTLATDNLAPPAASAASVPAPLPWEWFDFDDKPRAPATASVPSVDDGGARRVYQVAVDGRPVPFKFLRQRPSPGTARQTLLLVHGMGLTIASFRDIARYLFPTHDLLLPDYSSFSLSAAEGASGGGAAKVFAHSLWRIADAVAVNRVSIGGNSLGGGLCLLATLIALDRVDRLVLSNPACFPQALPRMYRIARVPLLGELMMAITPAEKLIGGVEYIGYADKTRFVPELRRRYERSMSLPENRYRLMHIMRHLPAGPRDMSLAIHVPRLGEIRQPVLISWGLKDPLLVEGAGERLAKALPNAIYETYPDLAHMPHEEAPDRLGPRWAAFLNQA